jgi:hypothetical protein
LSSGDPDPLLVTAVMRGKGGSPQADQYFHSELMELRCLIDLNRTLLPARADLISFPHSHPGRNAFTLGIHIAVLSKGEKFFAARDGKTICLYISFIDTSTSLYLEGQGFKSWTVDLSS